MSDSKTENSVAELTAQAAVAWREGDVSGTEAILKRLHALEPDAVGHKAGLYEVGVAYAQGGRSADAARVLEDTLAWEETAPSARTALGVVLQHLDRAEEAEQHLREAIAEMPGNTFALSNLGALLLGTGREQEAYDVLLKARELDPASPQILNNLALAASALGRVMEPIEHLQRAVKLAPNYTDAYVNLGKAFREAGRIADALEAYRTGLGIEPGNTDLIGNYLYCLGFDAGSTAQDIAEEHRKWGAAFAPDAPETLPNPPREVLKIGYLSPDFRTHSVAYFIEAVLDHHDRGAFEIHAYADVASPDTTTERLKAKADHWHDVHTLSDDALAAKIRTDGIDILIDLAGHTAHSRLKVFGQRAAPLQGSWIGYPNTTGVPGVDIRLVDPITDPPGTADELTSETLVRLPHGFLTYTPPEDAPEPAVPAADAPITFASFNNIAKVNDGVLALWARVLNAVPGSRLLLKGWQLADAALADEFRRRFQNAGGDPSRLKLTAHKASTTEHLALYNHVHVGLDPFPYNGTTTTCEALWMGVPVVTLTGDRHAARVGTALLTAVGQAEWIADTPDAYVDIAAGLASDRAALTDIRSGLREHMRHSPLLDGPGFVHTLEAAYRKAWGSED